MTVQRTRVIFKGKIDKWTDDQVRQFIGDMGSICDGILDLSVVELKLKGKKSNNN